MAVNAGMNGDAKPFDEVFPEPHPQPEPDAADGETADPWWPQPQSDLDPAD